jgi:serine protease Do
VRLIDQVGNAKTALGSGFVVGAGGRVVSNYHVISGLVNHPGRFRAEYLAQDGSSGSLELLGLDVVHDLALMHAQDLEQPYFALRDGPPAMGERLYSLGNPLDLGLTIVEGTYNGLLLKSLYERIHFTGSINHGMSGGPTLDEQGRVVGVNVATAGNQVSFLVPSKYVSELIAHAANQPLAIDAIDSMVARQLLDNQQRYLGALLAKDFATSRLAGYSVPGQLSDYMNCWGRTDKEPRKLLQSVAYSCSTDENIFLAEEFTSGSIQFSHRLWSSEDLGGLHFFNLLQKVASSSYLSLGGDEDTVTNFRCMSDFVENAGLVAKTIYCLRRYRQFDGLYDAYQLSLGLRDDHALLQSWVLLTGVSAENAALFARRFLEQTTWKP